MSPPRPRLGGREIADWCLALCAVAGSVAYIHAAVQLPSRSGGGDPVGPAAFPELIGIGLIGAGLLLAYELWHKRKTKTASDGNADPPRAPHLGLLCAMVAWTGLYYFAFEPVGYLLATVVYLFPMLAYFNAGRWRTNTAVAVGFALVVYCVFVKLLYVPLPAGILSF